MNLHKYVGHIVRLNQAAFRNIVKKHGDALENCFLVAGVSRELRKLICYGSNIRIIVGATDVVLI